MNIKDIRTYIGVAASWLLTLVSLIEVLLKVIALPSVIAQAILGVLLTVSLILTVYFFSQRQRTKIATIPSRVNMYLNGLEGKEMPTRELYVCAEKISVYLGTGPNNAADIETVMQRIVWEIDIANLISSEVNTFYMPITLGSLSSWQETVIPTAKIIKNRREETVRPEVVVFSNAEVNDAVANMRLLRIDFPKGMELRQRERARLRVTMQWRQGYRFKNPDFYFNNPEAYGESVRDVKLELYPADGVLRGWRMDICEVDKASRIVECQKSVILKGEKIEWKTVHKSGKMYMMWFTQNP